MATQAPVVDVAAGVSVFRDTCNVYVLRSGDDAVLIDFGSGAVLEHLGALGVRRVTDVLLTHHHRDQAQGLGRAVDAGARVWVPPVEQELFGRVHERWQARQVDNDYDLREDRFSLLEPVPYTGSVAEYRVRRFGEFDVYTLPTPGHTLGSVTYLVDVDGRRLAFTGDLVYGAGKVWSLAATQWTYDGVEGQAATIVSCAVLGNHQPDLLLPSHGDPVLDAESALHEVQGRLQELVNLRLADPWDLRERVRQPFDEITPHLLRNRTVGANSYVLLSASGGALLIDFGYDLTTMTPSSDRTGRRTLLWSIDALRRDYGVRRVEAVVTTHFHDDHVAGLNLLREVEGAEVWAPENVAPVLEDPRRYDLPCLWWEPIPVDRTLPLGAGVSWHEHELTAYELPGHTLYAAAIFFEVDGKRVLATGDQQADAGARSPLNYQYRNRFRTDDYVRSAELYRSLRPQLVISGHWLPREVTDEWLDQLLVEGRRVAALHRELLPEEGFGPEGFGARIEPYRSTVGSGDEVELEVAVRNPFDRDEVATVALVVPDRWSAVPAEQEVSLSPNGVGVVRFRIRPDPRPVRRARVAVDVTVGGSRFGQQAEALVDVE